jgi:hypothetical protein
VSDEDAAAFRAAWEASDLGPVVAHAPVPRQRRLAEPGVPREVAARWPSRRRTACDRLGVGILVLHAGARRARLSRRRRSSGPRGDPAHRRGTPREEVRVSVELMAGTGRSPFASHPARGRPPVRGQPASTGSASCSTRATCSRPGYRAGRAGRWRARSFRSSSAQGPHRAARADPRERSRSSRAASGAEPAREHRRQASSARPAGARSSRRSVLTRGADILEDRPAGRRPRTARTSRSSRVGARRYLWRAAERYGSSSAHGPSW